MAGVCWSQPAAAASHWIRAAALKPCRSWVDVFMGFSLKAGGRLSKSLASSDTGSHQILAGADVTRASATQQAAFTGLVGERVNGIAARVWDLRDPAASSSWHSTTIAAFASDTVALGSRLTVNGGLRFEAITGGARDDGAGTAGAAGNGVSWRDLFPRA